MSSSSGFIAEVARALYDKYGECVSSMCVLFPSKRARLFFTDAISHLTDRPLWQPEFSSIDQIMEDISGLKGCDRIRLVTELYSVYSQYHKENFDSFYFWGETLLSDFDSVDKYLIDADMLFANVADLKALEADLSYLGPDQAAMIARFWRSFSQTGGTSDEQKKFMEIWRTLGPIYHSFRRRLTDMGISYTGMAHRKAAEFIKADGVPVPERRRQYVIAGFNALTECEKQLFDYLSKNHDVEFFWDYDRYYTEDPQQEAGLFLRDNMARFPQTTPLPISDSSFSGPKDITVVEAPSDSMQCKYAGQFVRQTAEAHGGKVGKETAIVLTDENLLLPVLYAIPKEVDNINITMGYPLRNSLEYTFVERLLELQSRKRDRRGQAAFHHSDVSGLLVHPFMVKACGEEALSKNRDIIAGQRIYIEAGYFPDGFMRRVFRPVSGWRDTASYISGLLSEVTLPAEDDTAAGRRSREFASVMADNIARLCNSLDQCSIEISDRVFASLLRRMLQSLSIPYEGEPLAGLQIMGILETRNLDFENVVILSVNDDTFPGNRTSPSFIPHNLRFAYGLPTPAHHEGVFAYYFYRLLQRARNIHIVYCSRSDEKSTGEQSRYIYQLEYESGHTITRKTISVDANLPQAEPTVIEKDGSVMERLMEFTGQGKRKLSPTAFYNYIECPLKFYFRSVAGLKVQDEVAEDVDSPMFGTILHRAMEILYAPFVARPFAECHGTTDKGRVEEAVKQAINEKYLRDSKATDEDYSGNLLLVKEIVAKYINKCLLPYDRANDGFAVLALEEELGCGFDIESAGRRLAVNFTGKADRIDSLDNGLLRVVDYKTGSSHVEFGGVEALFCPQTSKNVSGAVLQTLLYSMMLARQRGRDVRPALYYVRKMNSEGFSPSLQDKSLGCEVGRYSDYAQEFERHLGDTLARIFDPAIPFTQCEDRKICSYCDFREICRR